MSAPDYNSFKPAQGQSWCMPVICPNCGGSTLDGRSCNEPSFRCADVRCAFRYGYRLMPDPTVNGTTTVIMAVPYLEDGVTLDHERAATWPYENQTAEQLIASATRGE